MSVTGQQDMELICVKSMLMTKMITKKEESFVFPKLHVFKKLREDVENVDNNQ